MLHRGRGQCGLGDNRQFDNEARSNRLVFLDANRAVMFFDDAAHNRQAEASPTLPGGEIWKKEFFLSARGLRRGRYLRR